MGLKLHRLNYGQILLDESFRLVGFNPSHYTHLPALYPIVLDSDHTERADELGEAGV